MFMRTRLRTIEEIEMDYPSVDEPSQEWDIPELDAEWNDWWLDHTFPNLIVVLGTGLLDVEADAA